MSGAIAAIASGVPRLWTPAQLGSEVFAWWDASYAPSISFGSGSNVALWTDRINGVVASQGNGAKQPTWSATANNNTPGLAFDIAGSTSLAFTLPSDPSVGGELWVCVALNKSATTVTTLNTMFAAGAYATGKGIAMSIVTGDIATLDTWNVGEVGINGAGAGSHILLGDALVNGQGDMFIDGVETLNTSLLGQWAITPLTGAIGSLGGSSYFFDGIIQQIVIVTGSLSTATRQKLEGWLAWTCGSQGVLPAGHPYKSAPPRV